jgi:hypothetical protein
MISHYAALFWAVFSAEYESIIWSPLQRIPVGQEGRLVHVSVSVLLNYN